MVERFISAALVLLLSSTLILAASQQPTEEEPQEIGLVEQTDTELTQIDVTVIGPPELASSLTREDFSLKINLTKILDFQVDRFCPAPPNDRSIAVQDLTQDSPATASYIFYIDQSLLTMTGRRRSIEIAQELIPRLITDGNRGMLISNGTELLVHQHLTTDPALLLAALKELEFNTRQWDTYGVREDWRIEKVIEALNDRNVTSGVGYAIGQARGFQKEEVFRTDKCLRRLKLSLGRLAELPPPKAVIYFADILRSNAGEHYTSFFGKRVQEGYPAMSMASMEAGLAALPFDRLLHEASALGIRLYTVLGQGLAHSFTSALPSGPATTSAGMNISASRTRQKDAENTLANMAIETGGHSFLRGESERLIATRILNDFACFYMLSFDPTGFSTDSPLRVVIKLKRDDLQLHVRGRTVVQSESARKTSRLLRAFTSPEEGSSSFEVQARLVPTAFKDGRYSVLLQLGIPSTPLSGATWDLGASIISRDKVKLETSGRIAVNRPGVPVIFESELQFKPGAYEIISVAHENSTGLVSSHRLELDWPDPRKEHFFMGPIALLQPVTGAFLRDAESRSTGSLARSPTDPIQPDKATALVGLLCRGRGQKGTYTVERKLVGESDVAFPPLQLDFTEEPCVQIRDLIPPNTLGTGEYLYEYRVARETEMLFESALKFFVFTPEE